jgi:hypothetical protein
MPYAVRKVRNKDCFRVYNKVSKRVFAKCTTMEQAQKQLRLLRAIQNNPKFRTRIKRTQNKKGGQKQRKTRKKQS